MKVVIGERDGHRLVRTTVPFGAGDVVMQLSTRVVRDAPTRTSIRIGPGRHSEDPFGMYVNHSCNPTCRVKDGGIVALGFLPIGSEITFDYTDNEEALASPFTCGECGQEMTGAPAPCKESR